VGQVDTIHAEGSPPEVFDAGATVVSGANAQRRDFTPFIGCLMQLAEISNQKTASA
jgi:hypothetical protein